MILNKVLCEYCKNNTANAFSFLNEENNKKHCFLSCDCNIEGEDYYISFKDFFKSEEQMEHWFKHLSRKYWFDEKDFNHKLSLILK